MCTARGLHPFNAPCVRGEGGRWATIFSYHLPTTSKHHVTEPRGELLLGLPIFFTTHHHGPCHIRLPVHEPTPPPTTITGRAVLLDRCLRRIRPHAHHWGGHPATDPHRGILPHGPPHGPHHLRGLLPRGTGGHGQRHRQNSGPPTRPPPARCPGLVCSGRHCRHTPTPPHSKTTIQQSHRDEPRHPSISALESPPQPSSLRPTSHRETRVPKPPIRKW